MIGAGLIAEAKASVTRRQGTGASTRPDPSRHDWEILAINRHTTHHVRLNISLVSMSPLNDVWLTITFYGHDDRRRIHALHTETSHIGTLLSGRGIKARTGLGTATVTETEYKAVKWRKGDDRTDTKLRRDREHRTGARTRSGIRYYGWTIEVYTGGQLVKTVVSTLAPLGSQGRDPATGLLR
ncbi:MAG: hypothetical protein JW889_16240 [Verrucomicrobia bacterium]|nr:hypothetical protein [Verrucomicrobiota bacterium]